MKPEMKASSESQRPPAVAAQARRLLLVGVDPEAAEQVELALPSTEIQTEDDCLGGLIHSRRENFDAVVLNMAPAGTHLGAILRAYRTVNAKGYIVLLCDVWDEPAAREMVADGAADEYVILPIRRSELAAMFESVLHHFATPPITSRVEMRMPSSESDTQENGAGWQRKLCRETAELIHTAGLGLDSLLERICWSAVFLFNADAARVEARDRCAQARDFNGDFDYQRDLLGEGEQLGTIMMKLPEGQNVDEAVSGVWLQLLPGLIRLASMQGQLQELANTDPLTGLANRRHMMDVLHNLLGRARQERFRVTLVLFDFDDFKQYNDAYGHPGGDEILRESAILIRRCIRRQDLAARFGGDEIAVILWDSQSPRSPGSEHPRSPLGVMERFCKLLKQHHFAKLGRQASGSLTVSGGLATFPWDAGTPEELIERADQALLEAKRSGKNRLYLAGQGPESKLADPVN